MVLGDIIPEPPANKGKVYANNDEDLRVTFNKVSDSQYNEYLSACTGAGFTVDAEKTSYSYKAFNSSGYKLDLSFISDDLSITLEAPMKLDTIVWPSSPAGKLLPIPKSTIGKFSYEREDSFAVYVGETPRAEYDAYVSACADKGFTVNYDKGEKYYRADNAEGWHISVEYEGCNIMRVDITAPKSNNDSQSNTTKATDKQTEQDKSDNSIDPKFKAAMDSYEAFIDEYVAFMKKYAESDGTDLSLLTDYAEYMSKYAEVCKDFEKWENEDLNEAEMTYYIDVQARVSKKLLEVVQ